MSYIVLARKWRPNHFEEVVGQGHVARTLKNSIAQDRVAHAYLFTGARGVGKTSMARILAKALNCHEGPTGTPCYKCPSCLEISTGQSVDVFEIDGASNRGINEIRELREGVRYAPSRDRYKVYIIDEVHMLTTEAFNALLKTLEEPPEHVKFVFATTEPQKIPVTILSRCQRFDFKRIAQQDIVGHLDDIRKKEGLNIDEGALSLIARQANGGMRDSLSLLDQVISFAGDSIDEEQVTQILGVANRKHLFELGEAVLKRDAQAALGVLAEVHQYGYDLGQFGAEFVEHLRDMTVVSVVDHPERVTELTEREIEQIKAAVAGHPTELLHRLFTVMVDGAQQMSRSPYPKLILEMTLVRLCQLEPMLGIDLLINRLRDLEGLLEDDMPAGDPAGGEKKKTPERRAELSAPAPSPAPPATTPTPAPKPAPLAPAPAPPEPVAAPPAPEPAPEPEPEPTPAPEPEPEPAPEPTPAPAPVEATAPPTPPAPAPVAPPEVVEAKVPPAPEPEPDPEPTPEPEPEPEPARPELEVPAWLRDGGNTRPGEASEEELSALFSSPPPAKKPDPEEELDPADLLADFSRRVADDPPPTIDPTGDPIQAWDQLVRYVRTWRAPLAATLEYAHVQDFTTSRLELGFVSTFFHFVNDRSRLDPLRVAARAAFGDGFEVAVETRESDEADEGRPTLAQLREAELERRKAELMAFMEGHELVKEVMAQFGEGVRMRVRVKLDDV